MLSIHNWCYLVLLLVVINKFPLMNTYAYSCPTNITSTPATNCSLSVSVRKKKTFCPFFFFFFFFDRTCFFFFKKTLLSVANRKREKRFRRGARGPRVPNPVPHEQKDRALRGQGQLRPKDPSAGREKESPSQESDEDAALEEDLIKRLLVVVRQRDEIINSLEVDRLRERQEDISIADHITKYHGELKNEKCLFSNTQEFLHNIFITCFK